MDDSNLPAPIRKLMRLIESGVSITEAHGIVKSQYGDSDNLLKTVICVRRIHEEFGNI
jgi:hypothetical protein